MQNMVSEFATSPQLKILTPLLLAMNQKADDDVVISVEDFAKAILWIYQQPQTVCIRDLVIAPTGYEA